jgi:hypothetical protein
MPCGDAAQVAVERWGEIGRRSAAVGHW